MFTKLMVKYIYEKSYFGLHPLSYKSENKSN